MKDKETTLHNIVLWLTQKQKMVYTILCSLATIGILLYQGSLYLERSKANKNVLLKKLAYEWIKSPKINADYDKIKAYLKETNDEELISLVSHKLIDIGQVKEGFSYLEKDNNQNLQILPYAKLSAISYLILQKNYDRALEESYKLKNEIAKDPILLSKNPSTIFIFNQLRIALLEKEMKHFDKAYQAFQELDKVFKGDAENKKDEIQNIALLFDSHPNSNLQDYIRYQKASVK
jgi:hypothetical protein